MSPSSTTTSVLHFVKWSFLQEIEVLHRDVGHQPKCWTKQQIAAINPRTLRLIGFIASNFPLFPHTNA